MSELVADMAAKVGVNLWRSSKKESAQILLGVPDEDYVGFRCKSYEHNKNLPSVALTDTTQTAANIQYHYEANILGNGRLAALTFPALENRITIENFEAGVDLAFKRYKKIKNALMESELGQFIYCQLEAPFDPETQTFYLHFHVFLTFGIGDASRRRVLALLKSKISWEESNAGLRLKVIAHKDVNRFIRYGTKPAETAFEIATLGKEKVFQKFLEISGKKQFTRSEAPLLGTLKTLKEQGRRPKFYRCEKTGVQAVGLVQKKDRSAERKADPSNNAEEGPGEPEHEPSPRKQSKTNIYCGCGQPLVSPDGKLLAFGLIQNFDEGSFVDSLKTGGPGSLAEANRLARRSWEINTGRPYNLKELLRPIALEILRALRATEVQNYTIIVSPNILKTLLEIESEENPKTEAKNRKTGRSSKPKCPLHLLVEATFSGFHAFVQKTQLNRFWSKVKSYISRLRK